MDPTLERLLSTWSWRPDVTLVLLSLGTAYVVGWRRVRRLGYHSVARRWRLAAYLGGLAGVALALLSPVEALAHRSFTGHMVQHQLLIMVAPPLVLLGNPFPLVMWALPRPLRRAVQGWLTRGRRVRAVIRLLTWMPVAGLLYVVTLWAWHLPGAYQAALGHALAHDLEHLTFFLTAGLFWWPVVNPAPRLHRLRSGLGYGLRIAYLILATAQNTLLGAVIGLSERVLYPAYAEGPGLFGWGPLDDQAFGGGIMWSGGHMYLIAILVLVGRALDAGSREGAGAVALRRERARP